jgi:uncharacterized protein YjaZ
MNHHLLVANKELIRESEEISGEYVQLRGDNYYRISGFDQMSPFFMTVVSSTDQWLFLASNGGISAGRVNPETVLFPYYTDDKIMDNPDHTGSKTVIRLKAGKERFLWEPFSVRYGGMYRIRRNLYKNKAGNKVLFEESNLDLELTFRYEWTFSPKFGFVKLSEIENHTNETRTVEILDGIRNIIPWGVGNELQNIRSTLVDAYKKNELIKEAGLGIFALSSMIVDRAEPSEALKATTVWSKGLENCEYLLSNNQVEDFRYGLNPKSEEFIKAQQGAFYTCGIVDLSSDKVHHWITVAELAQSTARVIDLSHNLQHNPNLIKEVLEDIERGTSDLIQFVGLADGLQIGADELCTGRHFSNVLFNIMRGGLFPLQYALERDDLKKYIAIRNHKTFQKHWNFLSSLPERIQHQEFSSKVAQQDDADLSRICDEYLPLTFSRRHGDPSRPWNYFNIKVKDQSGNNIYDYEGNWRDIFQNWEALAYAYPEFIKPMISKFLNASTADGYNPYRIMKNGIDWETIEPDDPWSYIGYWGDHQIIYLQKLLEHAERHFPGMLHEMLHEESFVFARVPYEIKPFEDILENPYDTIDFNDDLNALITHRISELGTDGQYLWDSTDKLVYVTLSEKLLITLLTKLYNFVPDGGIWLNTQRPEWNDANNALVGNGLSMVTLHYVRRFMVFVKDLFSKSTKEQLTVHQELTHLLSAVSEQFARATQKDILNPTERLEVVTALGKAGEAFRNAAYNGFKGEKTTMNSAKVVAFIDMALILIDKTLRDSQRKDGLYHAYNLLLKKDEGIEVGHLYEMLEGQVAALSSGILEPYEAHQLLDNLKSSSMFRPDQYSYMLYPNRELAPFIEKNTLSKDFVQKSKLLQAMLADGDHSVFESSKNGKVHFIGDLHNAEDLKTIIKKLKDTQYAPLAEKEERMVLDEFEAIFDHKSFTGRSGTFYGYEGLGSIYWHMVSKLLLAVQENLIRAEKQNADKRILGTLIDHYYEIRAGIGFNKTPDVYGAFPTDAYSHTPADEGAQQPGMTGQVKEDILNRWAELGLQVEKGQIVFNPFFFHKEELLEKEKEFNYIDARGDTRKSIIQKNEMAFTYCGVLIKYRFDENQFIEIEDQNRQNIRLDQLQIPANLSYDIFTRNGKIRSVTLCYPFS